MADAKDDRPTDSISYAASNLVRPGLQSRRQHSEPPTSRNVFPPTPPPETDRPTRDGSMRNGPKPTLAKLSIQTQDQNRKYEKAASPPDARPRPGRSASATPAAGYSAPRPLRRQPSQTIEEEVEAYAGEVYDMYSGGGGPPSRASRSSGASRQHGRAMQPRRYAEDEEGCSEGDEGYFDQGDFDMVTGNGGRAGPGSVASGTSSTRGTSRRAAAAPEVRKIRVKVRADDVRYVVVTPAIGFTELAERVRDKFALRRPFKMKVPDEDMPDGDMITMGDQDDLDMALASATALARQQRQEVAKMEVSLVWSCSW